MPLLAPPRRSFPALDLYGPPPSSLLKPRLAPFNASAARFLAPLVLVVDRGIATTGPALANVLEANGCKVRTARTGDTALGQLESVRPDVVLVEAALPGSFDGYETCHRIKADGRWRHLPVLLVTPGADTESRMRAFEVGAADALARSVPSEELLACVLSQARTGSLLRSLEERNAALRQEVAESRDHEEHLRRSLDRAVISGAKNRVRFCTDAARRLLRRFFPDHRVPDALPTELAAWLADGAHAPWQTGREGCQLSISLTGNAHAARAGRPFLLTLEENFSVSSEEEGPASLARLGLTRRETEVLYWIAHGKTNPETGMILRAAPNTIKKHMQNIMLKLGVENRLAAASRALEVIGLS